MTHLAATMARRLRVRARLTKMSLLAALMTLAPIHRAGRRRPTRLTPISCTVTTRRLLASGSMRKQGAIKRGIFQPSGGLLQKSTDSVRRVIRHAELLPNMTIKLPQRILQRTPGGHGRPIHQAQKKARRSIDLQLPVHLELMLPHSKKHLDVLRHRIRARTDRYPRRCLKPFELTITQRLIIFTQANGNPPEEVDDMSSTSNGGLLLPGAI
jgi:hypothetical protein